MSKTTYAGIDYGLGRTNVDSNGIRYGVIGQYSLSGDAMEDVWSNSRDLTYESAVKEAKLQLSRITSLAELANWIDEHLTLRMEQTSTAFAGEILDGYLTDDNEIVTPFPDKKLNTHLWEWLEDSFNDAYSMADCGDRDWLYEGDGYKLTNCLQSDVMVLASPYFTYAQFCSPCVPSACNLDSPLADADKIKSALERGFQDFMKDNRAYCLGHDYFEGRRAPYPVFSVATGELVTPEA